MLGHTLLRWLLSGLDAKEIKQIKYTCDDQFWNHFQAPQVDKVQASRPPFVKAWNDQDAIVTTGDTFSKPTKRSLATSKQTNPGAKIINKLLTAPLLRFESPQEARYAPFPNTELPSNVSHNTVCTAFSFSYACYFSPDTKKNDTQRLPLPYVISSSRQVRKA